MNHSPLVPFFLLTLGILWCFWLYQLKPSPSAPSEKRCHQVYPKLRSTLLIFSILLILSCVWYICNMCIRRSKEYSFMMICMYIIFMVMFFLQLAWIRRVCNNKQPLRKGCYTTDILTKMHVSTLVFTALLFIGVGCVGIRQ